MKASPFLSPESLLALFTRIKNNNFADSYIIIISCALCSHEAVLFAIRELWSKLPIMCQWVKPPGSFSGTGSNYIERTETIFLIYVGDTAHRLTSFQRYFSYEYFLEKITVLFLSNLRVIFHFLKIKTSSFL
jgi:hypothetical protein